MNDVRKFELMAHWLAEQLFLNTVGKRDITIERWIKMAEEDVVSGDYEAQLIAKADIREYEERIRILKDKISDLQSYKRQ